MRRVALGVVLVVRAMAVEHACAGLGGAISSLFGSGEKAGNVYREVLLERGEQSLFHDRTVLVPVRERINYAQYTARVGRRE